MPENDKLTTEKVANPMKRAARRLEARIAHARARMSERIVRTFFPWANFY